MYDIRIYTRTHRETQTQTHTHTHTHTHIDAYYHRREMLEGVILIDRWRLPFAHQVNVVEVYIAVVCPRYQERCVRVQPAQP